MLSESRKRTDRLLMHSEWPDSPFPEKAPLPGTVTCLHSSLFVTCLHAYSSNILYFYTVFLIAKHWFLGFFFQCWTGCRSEKVTSLWSVGAMYSWEETKAFNNTWRDVNRNYPMLSVKIICDITLGSHSRKGHPACWEAPVRKGKQTP